MRITQIKTAGCEGKSCPNILATDEPGMVAVQGRLATPKEQAAVAGDLASGEAFVIVPEEMINRHSER